MRFYTNPRRTIEYPFPFCSFTRLRDFPRYDFSHAILDIGIHQFDDPNIKEYPDGYLTKYVSKCKALTETFGSKIWCAMPDYCDDVNPGQFGDNVERTIKNIQDFNAIESVNWLPVVQARYLDFKSLTKSCQQVKTIIGDRPTRIAIGTVCKTKSINYIIRACQIVRAHFPSTWIHAFGLTIRSLPYIARQVDSFDSSAWEYRMRKNEQAPRPKQLYTKYITEYISRVEQIIGTMPSMLNEFKGDDQ